MAKVSESDREHLAIVLKNLRKAERRIDWVADRKVRQEIDDRICSLIRLVATSMED